MSASPGVPSVPRNSAEGLRFAQVRLATYGLATVWISLLFLGIDAVVYFVTNLQTVPSMVVGHLASTALALGLYGLAKRGYLSERGVVIADGVGTLLTSAVFVVALNGLPLWARPEVVQLICITDLLALRCFMLPSTARRTAVIGALAVSIVLVATYFLYAGPPVHPEAPGRSSYLAVAAVLGLVPIFLTAFTSHTIYGLRERVRTALQLGQYTLVRKIGQGAMGVVYEANHAMLRRRTAIKLLRPETAGAHNLVRFEREVQLTSTLTHPNTISIYDFGRAANGDLYYAMELLEGINLQGLVEIDGAQPPGRVIYILAQIAGALQEAHEVGLIHRDVKPANIFLCNRGGAPDVAKVLDFGLVKSSAEAEAAATQANTLIGTPLYLAPEAILNGAEVTAASDLYALGATAYFLLTGHPVFTGNNTVEVCGKHLHSMPERPSSTARYALSAELEDLVLACLAKEPKQRPVSAEAFATALRACPEAGTWDVEAARDWWRKHDRAILAHQVVQSHGSSSGSAPGWSQTVAVSLNDRLEPHPSSLKEGTNVPLSVRVGAPPR